VDAPNWGEELRMDFVSNGCQVTAVDQRFSCLFIAANASAAHHQLQLHRADDLSPKQFS
jgi:hypothetical protein